jgi:hypothetical protein
MESLERISQDFLKGLEQVTNAFNRLLAYRAPVARLPMQVTARVLETEQP